MSTHTGKIGRLNADLRYQLGSRIEDGMPGQEILAWLNNEPEAQATLKRLFDGREITEQNLSEWKQGGHREWLRLQESRRLANQLMEDVETLEEDANHQLLSDKLAVRLAVELAKVTATLMAEEQDPEKRWKQLREVHVMLSQLRRDDHRAVKTKMAKETYDRKVEAEFEAEQKRLKEDHKEKLLRRMETERVRPRIVKALKLDAWGEKLMELQYRIKNDEPYQEMMEEMVAEQARNEGKKPPEKAANQGKSK